MKIDDLQKWLIRFNLEVEGLEVEQVPCKAYSIVRGNVVINSKRVSFKINIDDVDFIEDKSGMFIKIKQHIYNAIVKVRDNE